MGHKAKDLARKIGCSTNLAEDLLVLASEDANLVEEVSDWAENLAQLKYGIIDTRFNILEDRIERLEQLYLQV